MHQYILKVVPTTYVFVNQPQSDGNLKLEKDNEQLSHQFAITRTQKEFSGNSAGGIPGVFIQYEFSPLMVRYEEKKKYFCYFFIKCE